MTASQMTSSDVKLLMKYRTCDCCSGFSHKKLLLFVAAAVVSCNSEPFPLVHVYQNMHWSRIWISWSMEACCQDRDPQQCTWHTDSVSFIGKIKGDTCSFKPMSIFASLKTGELYLSKFILHFHFLLQWFISIDLRNDSNNSVTCIKSYAVSQ